MKIIPSLHMVFFLAFTHQALSQCVNPVSFQNTKNIPSASLLTQHYMTAKRDSSASRPYLYIAAKANGLIIYNISNPNSPGLVGSVPGSSLGGLDVNNMTQAGNYLYLALGDIFNANAQKSGMAIVDISSPLNPQVKSVYTFSANSGAGSVAVDGDYAYLAAMQNGVITLNVSNKSSIQFVSRIKPSIQFPFNNPSSADQLKINARSIVIKNNTLFLCYDAGGIRVLDASNKSNIKETGRYCNPLLTNRPRAYNNAVLNDSLLYTAADYCGMEILNVKDTAHIALTGWWNPWKCQSASNTWFNSPGHTNEIEYDPACKVVFMSAGRSDLMAVNVSNPALPDSCSQFGLKTDSAGTWGVGRYNNQLYLAYISTWPLFIPFRSEWSGIKIVSYNNACSTGLNEITDNSGIRIYPNPAQNSLRVHGVLNKGADLQLYAPDGKLVWQYTLPETKSELQIGLARFNAGVYFLRFYAGGHSFSQRVIIAD